MRRPGDPWRQIAHDKHIHVRLVDGLPEACGGGALVRLDHGEAWILLDRSLTRAQRRCILAHEVEHLRRGSVRWAGAPATWATAVAQEECTINRTVARQLVPLDELRAFAAQRTTVGPVTLHDVAEHFDVTPEVAREACRQVS